MADTTSISKIKIGTQEYLIKDNDARVSISTHTTDTNNPHSVTKAQVGLGNVENKSSETIRGELTSSNVTTALGYTPVNPNVIGANNGIASLDSTGKVPSSQLPSFVDDVIEGYLYDGKFYKENTHQTEIAGESGKIYVNLEGGANTTHRWSGSDFVEISESLALGETSGTAYRGDYGKIAYDHATDSSRLTTATAAGFYKVGVTAEGHVSALTAVAKSDITALGIPGSDTTYSAGTGLDLSGTTFNHSNSVTAGNCNPSVNASAQLVVGGVTYDAQGHVTAKASKTVKVKTPTITVSKSEASTLTAVATAGTTPAWSASVESETLEFSWSAGAMPTFTTGNRMTGATASSSDPEFEEVTV